jgi:F0F1-type ATP synthase membrane subunit c/vacuolar-type H+-ATPase subunit K
MQNKKNPRQVMLIIWGAMTWSLCLFIYLVYASGQDLGAVNGELDVSPYMPGGSQHSVFMAMAVVALILSILFPRFLFKSLVSKSIEGPKAEHLFAPWIMRLALSESVALFGFILGTQTGVLSVAVPFFALCFFNFVNNFPSQGNIDKWLGSKRF